MLRQDTVLNVVAIPDDRALSGREGRAPEAPPPTLNPPSTTLTGARTGSILPSGVARRHGDPRVDGGGDPGHLPPRLALNVCLPYGFGSARSS